jgi:uncharacterized delta-60 repeat protein
MKKIGTVIAFLAFTVLAACNTNPASNLEVSKKPARDSTPQVLGVIELELSSGTGSVSGVKFVQAGAAGGLHAQGTPVALTATNWVFTPGVTTDMADTNFKYLQNTFSLENKTNVPFSNLAMYALNTPAIIAGTAFSGIKALDNSLPSSSVANAVARGMIPTHGMLTPTTVDPNKADLMLYTPQEAAVVQSQLTAQNNFTIINPTVLEYGFVARNLSGGRAIGTDPNAACPGPNCNKAKITWAFKLPLSLLNAGNLWKFSLRYLVVNEPGSFGVQSPEEQAANTLGGNAIPNFDDTDTSVRALKGTTYQVNDLRSLLQVKTAKTVDDQNLAVFMRPPVAQVTASGALDNYFGANGKRMYKCNAGGKTPVAVQNDGKIVTAWRSDTNKITVARFMPDGNLDLSFGTGGMLEFDVYDLAQGLQYPNVNAIAIANGRIVIGGSIGDGFMVIRLLSNGALDGSLNGVKAGIGMYSLPSKYISGEAMVVKENIGNVANPSTIVVAGWTTGNNDFTVAKIMDNGSLDASFNSGNIQVTNINGSDRAYAVGIQPDDKIVLAGSANNQQAIVRYNTDGILDSSFGTAGVATSTLPAGLETISFINGLKIVGDSIFVGGQGQGQWNYYPFKYFIAKYRASTPNAGTLDSGFAGTGYVTGTFANSGEDNIINDLVVLADGSIIAAGLSNQGSNNLNSSLVKYDSTGTPVNGFGSSGNGRVSLDLYGLNQFDQIQNMTLLSNGKIVTSGTAVAGPRTCHSLAIFNP